jgi:hypothetical protein
VLLQTLYLRKLILRGDYMTMQHLTPTEVEFADRGKAWYTTRIKSQVESQHQGQVVAIDIETGEFEVGENTLSAAKKLLARFPQAQMWFERIGHVAVHKVGFAGSTIKS